ncbi:MAG: hypothetical protein ISS53_04295 [Dehalococcoidia bacterium]|nr:hypothetical protein [Dehalococcoidia bacterium]
MVMELIASREYNWQPQVVEADDPQVFKPNYVVAEEAETCFVSFKTKFGDLPSSGIWADRTESDDELLEELGSGWRGFATEP